MKCTFLDGSARHNYVLSGYTVYMHAVTSLQYRALRVGMDSCLHSSSSPCRLAVNRLQAVSPYFRVHSQHSPMYTDTYNY